MRIRVVVAIARHEFRSLAGSSLFWWSLAVFAALLVGSAAAGWRDYQFESGRNRQAEAAERSRWLNQGIKGAHAAIDQGVFVFQPLPVLSAFDPGVLPYTGSADLLGGDHQELLSSRRAEGTHTLHRLGFISPAKALQTLLPLMLILVLYSSICGEREIGTLRQLLSLGISPGEVIAGKVAGLMLPVTFLVAMPAIGIGVLLFRGTGFESASLLPRLALLVLCYAAWLAIVGGVSLAISGWCSTSRQSLSILLTLWLGVCVLIPIWASDFAATASPSPSAIQHAIARLDVNAKLPTVEEHRTAIRKQLLTKYRVATLRELPVDPIGIELLEDAESTDAAFGPVVNDVYNGWGSQVRQYEAAGILSPMIPVQQLSMTLSGTDLSAHRSFVEAAEQYRVAITRMMNEATAYNPHYKDSAVYPGTDIIISLGGPDLWRRVPEFRYIPARLDSLWPRLRTNALLLGLWLALSTCLLVALARRLRTD